MRQHCLATDQIAAGRATDDALEMLQCTLYGNPGQCAYVNVGELGFFWFTAAFAGTFNWWYFRSCCHVDDSFVVTHVHRVMEDMERKFRLPSQHNATSSVST